MLLAFDVGNTNIVLGVFKDGKMITNWRWGSAWEDVTRPEIPYTMN